MNPESYIKNFLGSCQNYATIQSASEILPRQSAQIHVFQRRQVYGIGRSSDSCKSQRSHPRQGYEDIYLTFVNKRVALKQSNISPEQHRPPQAYKIVFCVTNTHLAVCTNEVLETCCR